MHVGQETFPNKNSCFLRQRFTVASVTNGRRMPWELTFCRKNRPSHEPEMISFCGYIKIKDYDSHKGKERPTGSNHCGLIEKLAGKGLFCQLWGIFGLVGLIKKTEICLKETSFYAK
jgi:hypothetical protein